MTITVFDALCFENQLTELESITTCRPIQVKLQECDTVKYFIQHCETQFILSFDWWRSLTQLSAVGNSSFIDAVDSAQ